MGYGQISPRNAYEGGQETNCRINNLILEETKKNNGIDLWFLKTNDYKKIEKLLRLTLNPIWNKI